MLTTGRITVGPGEGQLQLDGGTLVASENQSGFVASFLPGSAVLGEGGGTIDSNGYDIGVTSDFSGLGGLIKTGLGVLMVSGNNTYTGATFVSAGTLRVIGSITSSVLTTVNPGATLAGTGTVGATLLNGGTIAPGNGTLGTLSVNGGFTATSGSFAFSLANLFTSQLLISGDGFSLTGNSTGVACSTSMARLRWADTRSSVSSALISLQPTGISPPSPSARPAVCRPPFSCWVRMASTLS